MIFNDPSKPKSKQEYASMVYKGNYGATWKEAIREAHLMFKICSKYNKAKARGIRL